MALKPAGSTVRKEFRAWVLGPRAASARIVESLEHAGIPAAWASFPGLPSPDQTDSGRKLVAWMKRYLPEGDWIHPGIDPWADRPELEGLAQRAGLSVIGPSPKVLTLFQNQLSLLSLAQKLGIPHLAVDFEPIQSFRELEKFVEARAQRLPFVLKSIRPSNRQRLCLIQSRDELRTSFGAWQEQLRAFSRGGIFFAESYLEGGRFITVPVARTFSGKVHVLDLIDGSLMSRNRKLIEVSPAWTLEPDARVKIIEYAEQLANACDLHGVAFFDFLVEADRPFFVGGVARLSSSFPIVSGKGVLDPVICQAEIWQGNDLPVWNASDDSEFRIMVHLYSEDELYHLPRPGKVMALTKKREWRHLGGVGRLYLSVDIGQTVPEKSDGNLGFFELKGRDRESAFSFARLVLGEFWMSGTLLVNDAFTSQILEHAWVKEGLFHAGFVDEDFVPFHEPSSRMQRLSVTLCQGLEGAILDNADDKGNWMYGERLTLPLNEELKWVSGPKNFTQNGRPGVAGILSWDPGNGVTKIPVMVAPAGVVDRWLVRVGPFSRMVRRTRASRKGKWSIYSQVSGRVHSIRFQAGATLPAHEPIILIESLQNLVPHSIPISMRVKKWKVKAEDAVLLGQELAELEPGP